MLGMTACVNKSVQRKEAKKPTVNIYGTAIYQQVKYPDCNCSFIVKVVIVDSCEYLKYDGLTHKGDCKNPVHQRGK